MTDITKLAGEWRKATVWIDGKEFCAKQLEAALPKWTKITEDESTWPDEGQRVMSAKFFEDGFDLCDVFQHNEASYWMGDWWRPLCDLDYPPEESE